MPGQICANCSNFNPPVFNGERGWCLQLGRISAENGACGHFDLYQDGKAQRAPCGWAVAETSTEDTEAEKHRASKAAFERLCSGAGMLGKMID